ncbi:uncharacterized protein BHQ10_006501 [Talaromyces amestolkiae]|uniref:Uncharacterized protein n=1 Tax=Talaromyces amestolkiae TaxID=1196081 RepID=A0A364L3U7_TALAM|nr:uncharacterized protein BHQ10_006501 [Talaromyces amestolkiae]RAO70489.1 hypothetical protein BHQ10_006501 [Talaromyces amestolkiae]
MKTAAILPLLCVLAASAPTPKKAPVEDVHRRQTTDVGDAGLGSVLGGLKARQDAGSDESDPLGGLLGGLRRRQSSESENGGLGGVLGDLGGLGGLEKRQDTATLRSAITSITDDLPVSANQRRQSSVSGSDNDDNDDSLLNLLDGSDLKLDGNGQDINVADLRRRQRPSLTNNRDANGNNDDTLLNAVDGSRAGVNHNAQNISIAKYRRKRQLLNGLGGESESVSNSGNGDNDESLLNLLDGSSAQVDHNVKNVTILRRYQLQQHQSRHESVSLVMKARRWLSTLFSRDAPTKTTTDSGNANDDDALVNALDDSAAAVDGNGQDVTVLRRRQASTPTPSASAVPSASAAPIAPAQDPAAAPGPRPALNAADGDNSHSTNTNTGDNNHSDDDALVNAADGSGADVSKNLQNITILKHRRQDIGHNDEGDHNADDDETVANALDGSDLNADDNAQGVDVAPL